MLDNYMRCTRYLFLALICGSYYIALVGKSAGVIIMLTLFAFPPLCIILWWKIKEQMVKQSSIVPTDIFSVVQRLRQDESLTNLSNFEDFISAIPRKLEKFQYLPLLEAKIYCERFKMPLLAMLKLTKLHCMASFD